MNLEVIKVETPTPLPKQQFVNELKRLITTWQENQFDLETLCHRIQTLKQETRIQVPIFKIERWFVWMEQNPKVLYIRYGDSGDPQIIVKEVAA